MKYFIVICLFMQVLTTSAFAQAYKYHTVQAGETVYSIARDYNISKEAIFKYNPDAKNGIQIGTKLVVPVEDDSENSSASSDNSSKEPETFTSHTVEKKETLYGLSREYNITIDDLKRYNKQLYSKELQLGDVIQIPVYAKSETSIRRPSEKAAPSSQISKTREHIVLPKETKYGIARKYGMTVKELEELNPTVDVLHPGIMLKVSTNVIEGPVIITSDNFKFYEVKPQETLYSLTRRFQVETDSLMALNPALKDGLKSGMILKVPTKDATGKELSENPEKIFNPSETETVNLENNIKDFQTKNVALMLPYSLSSIKNDSVSNEEEVLKNNRVLRISLDFYSGVLLAVEKAQELGISTNLKVYDTQQQAAKVQSLISAGNFNDVDVVIGPLLQSTSEEAASMLIDKNIPVVSPMTNRELKPIPNLYQARPSDEMLREAMIDYIVQHSQNKNLVIMADAASSGIRSKLISAFPGAHIVTPANDNIAEETLNKALKPDQENWVIVETKNVALLSSAVSALSRIARDKDITMFTTDKNKSYESDAISNEQLGNLKLYYPSEYKEFNENGSDEFINAFKEKYGVIPNKYAVRGYDLTLDILLRMAAMGSLEKSVQENIITEYVENKFLYRPKPNGGFYNYAVYIMHLNPDLSISPSN